MTTAARPPPPRGAPESPPSRYRCRRFDAAIAGHRVHLEIGEYPDGRPCALRLDIHKEGSDYRGIMAAFAESVTHGLQRGVPLSVYVDGWIGCRFMPAGMTDDPDLPVVESILDWIGCKLLAEYPEHAACAAPVLAAE